MTAGAGTQPVVILGAGGYAGVVYEILSQQPELRVIGCTDKALGISERTVGEGVRLPILGDDDALPGLARQHPGLSAVLALGPDLMDVRAQLIQTLMRLGIEPRTAIHPQAIVSRTATLGAGTVVRAGAAISDAVQLGPHGMVGLASSIDHHTAIGANVYVGQGARVSTYVEVEDQVVIEMGASINSRVKIGRGARITGGAFVNTDIPELAVVVGVPGRVVRYLTA